MDEAPGEDAYPWWCEHTRVARLLAISKQHTVWCLKFEANCRDFSQLFPRGGNPSRTFRPLTCSPTGRDNRLCVDSRWSVCTRVGTWWEWRKLAWLSQVRSGKLEGQLPCLALWATYLPPFGCGRQRILQLSSLPLVESSSLHCKEYKTYSTNKRNWKMHTNGLLWFVDYNIYCNSIYNITPIAIMVWRGWGNPLIYSTHFHIFPSITFYLAHTQLRSLQVSWKECRSSLRPHLRSNVKVLAPAVPTFLVLPI